MKAIKVCTYCGSPRVFADSYVGINTGEVRTYDHTHCDDCEGECSVTEVAVGERFDLEIDFYEEDSE